MSSLESETPSLAFLLAQLGAHATSKYADALAPLNLTPALAATLRALSRGNGLSQQALAGQLQTHASRLVGILDELEALGFLERKAHALDRRTHELHLTSAGQEQVRKIRRVGQKIEGELCAALRSNEHAQLIDMLERIAARERLAPGVHPGFRSGGRAGRPPKS